MARRSNYSIALDRPDMLVLVDEGPHDQFLSITNDAEQVVADLVDRLAGRRLIYLDSYEEFTELVVENGRFKDYRFPEISLITQLRNYV